LVDEELEGETSPEDEVVPAVSYDVTSYGSDPEIEGLVNRIRRGDIIIPPFQRDYVWRQPEASKFIESLLLGLPVPGVFFATDPGSNRQLVIDGQQRLKTLLYFYDGFFNPRPGDIKQRVFMLTKVQKPFEGKTYKTLEERDRVRLDTSIMHATTVKQSAPPGDDTSLYHIFERLNSGGRRLTDQEMRLALYHGELIERVKLLNTFQPWRKVFGKIHSRLKDQELILRFFSLYQDVEKYERPLSEFLSKYAGRNRNPGEEHLNELSRLFKSAISVFLASLNIKLFRLTKTLNVAVYDSCMVGMAKRIAANPGKEPNAKAVELAYQSLLKDNDYIEAVSRSTADDAFVRRRIKKAIEKFAGC
jgi:uncharacterized protein with ParB-like and HNH nuclease domain